MSPNYIESPNDYITKSLPRILTSRPPRIEDAAEAVETPPKDIQGDLTSPFDVIRDRDSEFSRVSAHHCHPILKGTTGSLKCWTSECFANVSCLNVP